MTDCGHPLCALIGGPCSLATRRSRGCRPNLGSRHVAPELLDEVRALVAIIDPDIPDTRGERVRKAAARLAEIMRREALEDRSLLAYARLEEPELAPALARLCVRPR